MKHIGTATLAVAVMFVASPLRVAARAPTEHASRSAPPKVFVFGDSLSDNGNLPKLHPELYALQYPPEGDPARMSNGPIWVDYVSRALGTPIVPELDGGTNYAVTGATISPENYLTRLPDMTGFAQVERFLAKYGSADPKAIYVVWLGGNDIDPPAAYTEWTYGTLVEMIGRLHAAGARTFLVPNVEDIGKLWIISYFFGPEYAAQLSEMSVLWNELLRGLPATFPDARIRIADFYGLRSEIDAHPAAFGFTNTTEPCFHQYTDGSVCSDPDSYWSWDGAHPTTRAHKLLASMFVLNMLVSGEIGPKDLVPAR